MEYSSDMKSLFIKLNKLRATMVYSELKALGLTGPQLFILKELFHEQPRTIGDLSKSLELSNSTVTGIVDRLERQGLVERKRSDKDRRVVWICTTGMCEKVKERFERIHSEFLSGLDREFTPEQFVLLRKMLETIIAHLEKIVEGYK